MAVPVHETVCALIAAALAQISNANGFEENVQRVERFFKEPRAGAHDFPYLCLVDGHASKRTGSENAPHNHYEVAADFTVWGFCEVTAEDASTRCNQLIACIERALLRDDALKGGRTVDSPIDHLHLRDFDHAIFEDEAPVGVVSVTFQVIYQHKDDVSAAYNGPYTN